MDPEMEYLQGVVINNRRMKRRVRHAQEPPQRPDPSEVLRRPYEESKKSEYEHHQRQNSIGPILLPKYTQGRSRKDIWDEEDAEDGFMLRFFHFQRLP